ncbi:MAG: phosphoglycerate dehydrogenase, partial [Chitinophagaceae bacterium]
MPEKKTTSYPKEKINILFLENISDLAMKNFLDAGYVNVKKLSGALSEAALIKEIRNVHLLGIRSKTQVTPAVLAAATKLQAIGCFCIGVNQVNLQAATAAGIAVFNAPYSNTRSVAELVIGASIMLVRKVLDKSTAAHQGSWMKDATGAHELRGKTIG